MDALEEAYYLYVDVQEASLGHLEHEAHLRARVDPLVEALLSMSIYANKVAGRGSTQSGQQDNKFWDGKHNWNDVLKTPTL